MNDILKLRNGFGIDVHGYGKDLLDAEKNSIMLCGVPVPYNREVIAHSDGDLVLHALTDALLGSASLGDIGTYFPSSDIQWKDKNSVYFLNYVLDKLKAMHFLVLSVDLTIICQQPKISKYVPAMKEKIATLLSVDIERVSVKATTTDYLGFLGRKEGIASTALVLVYKEK